MNAPLGPLVALSWRGLLRRPARSVTTAAGVAVATTGLTVLLSLGAGLGHAVDEQMREVAPQLQVSRGDLLGSLTPPPTLPRNVVRQVEERAHALGLAHVTPVVLVAGDVRGLRVTLYGIPASAGFSRVYRFTRVGIGRGLAPRDEGRDVVLLGSVVARHLGVRPGDVVTVPPLREARIVGVLAPTGAATDGFVIAPLTTLQRALGVGSDVSLAAVEVRREGDVSRVAEELS
ncbi:ABC transporter permease, partial [Deinococcus pimensis]|uniref:ABC transporter permease n=1 Tax=Deinococcus pimensis TaxID=309888 RepID=UPI00146F9703